MKISYKLQQKTYDELLVHAHTLEENLREARLRLDNGVVLRNNMLQELCDARNQNRHLREFLKVASSQNGTVAEKTKQEVEEVLIEELEPSVRAQLRKRLFSTVRKEVEMKVLEENGVVVVETEAAVDKVDPKEATEMCDQLLQLRKEMIAVMCDSIDQLRLEELEQTKKDITALREEFKKDVLPRFKGLAVTAGQKRQDWELVLERLHPKVREVVEDIFENPCEVVLRFQGIYDNFLLGEACLQQSLERATKRIRSYGV